MVTSPPFSELTMFIVPLFAATTLPVTFESVRLLEVSDAVIFLTTSLSTVTVILLPICRSERLAFSPLLVISALAGTSKL